MSELAGLKNIGPAMEKWLMSVGILNAAQLKQLGAVEAYLQIKPLMRHPNLMALYALYGAIHDVDCMKVSPEEKEMLKGMLEE